MKYAHALLLYLAVISGSGFAQQQSVPTTLPREENLQSLMTEALSQNPDIAAEFHRMDAAIRRVPQAGALDDPELVFKLMEIPGTKFNEAMFANVELMQMVPFPSKLTTRHSLANILSEQAHHQHAEKIVQVIADLKTGLAMLWFGRESSLINATNQRLLKKILRVAETAYSVGKVPQQEILRTRIELAKLISEESMIQEQIASAESMVRRILNRPADVPLGQIELGAPTPLPPLFEVLAYAKLYKPMLKRDSLNVMEKEMNVRLMRQEYIPNLKLSAEYVRLPMTMENRWSISVGITVPFAPWTLSKASSRVQEAESERMMSSSMYVSAKNMVESEIRSKYAALKSLQTQLHQLQEVVLPMLNQSIDLLLADYETGRTSYLMVLDGYRMYNDMRRDRAMAVMKYHETTAGLEREVGVTDIFSTRSTGKEQQQ